MKIEVVLDDGVGLFWMWVVLEMPCGVGQRSGSGGRVNAEFLESAGNIAVQGVNTTFWAPMFWGPNDSDNREAGVFKHRESAGTRK